MKMVGGIGSEKERDETMDGVCAKVRGAIEEKAKVRLCEISTLLVNDGLLKVYRVIKY